MILQYQMLLYAESNLVSHVSVVDILVPLYVEQLYKQRQSELSTGFCVHQILSKQEDCSVKGLYIHNK